ncbi:MAG: Veg family protein [Bacilli bacterium]|nr:Veg family protein [Bacilli bacterium]
MIIDNVIKVVNSYVGKRCKFIYHGSRNQKDIFEGIITKTFPAIFIITSSDGSTKSYSYSDVLTATLEIID